MPLFHFFRTLKHIYLYDANTNSILKISSTLFKELKEYKKSGYKNISSNIHNLKERGFLTSKEDFVMEHPMNDMLEISLSRNLKNLAIQVTQNCNLRCSYCSYSGSYHNRVHTNKRMDKLTAFKCIDFFVANSIDSSRINIGFYGGEPILEFELIKNCMEYAKEKAKGRELTFGITTNATLLTDEIIEYFAYNKVRLSISLDGDKNTHDRNRVFAVNNAGSFHVIMKNIENIRAKHPDYVDKINFLAVIDPSAEFSCVSNFFTDYHAVKDFYVTTNLIANHYSMDSGVTVPDDNYVEVYNYEVFKLFLNKFGRLGKEHISKIIAQNYEQIKSRVHDRMQTSYSKVKKDHHSGPCVPGVERLFIDVEGHIYPCERASEASAVMKMGHIDTGFDIESAKRIMNIGKITEKQCRECWAFRYCTCCAVLADDIDDFSASKKLTACTAVKRNTEKIFKDYCIFKELGYDFEIDSM